MTHDTIVVFTKKGSTVILNLGGSQAWKLDPKRARKCSYLVCTQNRHSGGTPEAPHGAAFLVGKVSGVELVPDREDGRWLVRISEYARLEEPHVWDGGRNPVRYTTLQDLGIDPATLDFQPMPEPSGAGKPAEAPDTTSAVNVRPLGIPAAKLGLAAYFGVDPDMIEITIRG